MAITVTSISALKDAVRSLMLTITGVDQVETKVGGVPGWIRLAEPGMTFWEVNVERIANTNALIGTVGQRTFGVVIEGWSPWNYEAPDTTQPWETVVDSVVEGLIQNRKLVDYLPGGVCNVTLPNVDELDVEVMMSGTGARETTLCHHAKITVGVEVRYTYTTR